MHRLLRTSLVVSFFWCCSMFAATTTSDLIAATGKVEKYIKVQYSEEVQLKLAIATLNKIISSQEPNNIKLQRLKIEFPEAFTQKLLFHKPLSITIHGFDIGWDVTQERNLTTSNTIRDKYSKEIQAIEDDIKNGRVIIDEEGSVSTTLTTDYNVVTENVSSILKVIFEGKVSVKDSYEKIEKDTIVQRYFFAKCRENIRNDIQHTKTMKQHLIFTITLKNNSGEKLTVPRDEMNVPVYYSKAKSANIYAKPKINKVYEILPGSTIDIIMRADLDTTNALALVDFMRYSEPVIRFDNSGTKIITPSGRNVLRESFDTNDKITLSLICRYPNVKRDWYFEKINPTTRKKTTYYDIFKEIENQNSGQRVFFYRNGFVFLTNKRHLDNIFKIPFGKLDDRKENIAFLMLNGNIVPPEKINCNEPVESGEISVWVVSLANIAHCPPEIRREVVAYLMNESKNTKNLGDGKHFLNIVNKKWGISVKEACEILNKIPKAQRHSKVADFLEILDFPEKAKKEIANRQYKRAAEYFEKYLEIGQPYHPDMKIYVDNCLTRQHGSQYNQPEKFRKWNEAYPGKFTSW